MKITIDVRKIHDSGVGTYITNLVPLVIQAMPAAHFYLLGRVDDLKQQPWTQAANITLVDMQSRPYSVREQAELLRKIPIDTDLLWVPFINIPLLYRGKMLVTVCDVAFLALPQFLSLSQRLYARLMFTAIRHKADQILCISDFTKHEFMRLVPGQKSNITTTLLGTPPQWFHVQPIHRPHPKPYFLFVGNVKPHKNLGRLIGAFRQIADRIPHDLVIVGRKEGFIISDQAVLDSQAALGDRVVFTGYIEEATLQQYFAHAAALVFPSLYEGFGIPALEAMACGCPTIVSNSTSLPEVCGDAVLYCDPYSVQDIARQMLRLATDEILRAELIAKGKHRAYELTYEQCALKTIDIVKRCIGSI